MNGKQSSAKETRNRFLSLGRSGICGVVFLFLQSTCCQAVIADEGRNLSGFADKYDRLFDQLVLPHLPSPSGNDELGPWRTALHNQIWSELERMLLMRWVAANTHSMSERIDICEKSTIKGDDYVFKSLCIGFGNLPLSVKRQELERIFDEAIENFDGTYAASKVASYLLDLLWMQNDIASARIIYTRALAYVPKGDLQGTMDLKQNLALIYTNTDNSPSVVQEGLKIYDEMMDYYIAEQPDDSDSINLISYNQGIARFIPLEDYERALRHFEKVAPGHRLWVDARIMAALSQIRIGKLAAARQSLSEVNFENYADESRIPFLKCYLAIAHQELGIAEDLGSCVNLPEDIQANRIIHITKVMSGKTLEPSIEIALWRQYWRFYTRKIAPQFQIQSDAHVTAMELERSRFDGQIKDLKLKNFSLIKVLFALTLLALAISIVSVIRIRAKSEKIQKLQSYIHKSILSRFLPPVLVEEIIQGKSRIESEPCEELITVVFSDMVGFTSISNQIGPSGSADILNRYMKRMSEIIYKHGGTIDKFMGDAVMVIFGAPIPLSGKQQAERALTCAADMILAMERLNLEFKANHNIEVDVRIGINQGRAIVGTFGDERRSDYTAIGPTVNLASRIESVASPHEVLFTMTVAEHIGMENVQDRGMFRLKGIGQEVPLFVMKKLQMSA